MTNDSHAAPAPAEDPRQRIKELSRRVYRLHHGILDKDILRGLLPIRAATVPHRSASPEARERETRFRGVSPAYVAAVEDRDSYSHQTRVIDLDSLRWWVPLLRPDDPAAVARSLSHQDFPYRVITQTREVGVGGLMLDIGANVGRMSVPRAVLGDVTAVYCAEPDPLNYTCLVRNVRDNGLGGLVMPDCLAIGSDDGVVRLERGRSTGGHKVIEPTKRTRHEVVEVRSLTLDTWVEHLGIDLQQLVFIKVDAQGSEVHVLRGASRVLACRHVSWQIEIDLPLLASRGFTAEDLYEPLRRHFSHFIDLNRQATGQRARPTGELADALSYVSGGSEGRTDVLVFNLHPWPAAADADPA